MIFNINKTIFVFIICSSKYAIKNYSDKNILELIIHRNDIFVVIDT